MSDDDERTVIERIYPRRRTRQNDADNTGARYRAPEAFEWFRLWPIIATVAAGLYGYGKLESKVQGNADTGARLERRIDVLESRFNGGGR